MKDFESFGGTHLAVILMTSLLEEGMLLVPPKRKVSEPSLEHLFDICRSAVRARLEHDIKLAKVLAVCLTPSSRATLLRAQRVALCLFSFSATYKIPTALVQPSASLLW